MTKVNQEYYDLLFRKLSYSLIRTIEYEKLIETPTKTTSKGKTIVDKHALKKNVKKRQEIFDELVLGKIPLTKPKPKNLIKLENDILAHMKGDKTRQIWRRSKQGQSQQNS